MGYLKNTLGWYKKALQVPQRSCWAFFIFLYYTMWENKDWTWNHKTTFVTLGASSHAEWDRQEEDYYATDPIAAKLLLENHNIKWPIWEPSCWQWHLAKEFEKHFYVNSTDLVYRWYWNGGVDFMMQFEEWHWSIITNPPYSIAKEYIEKAISLVRVWDEVVMFLKIQFLEWKARKRFFAIHPPKVIYISSSRIKCAKNWNFAETWSSAVAYARYVREKWYKWDTIIKWIN